jgi:hypothetical protein
LVFHFPHYQGDTPHSAIIKGDMKLIKFYEDNKLLLFDLSKDLRESNNLATKMPEETKSLHKDLNEYLTAIQAQLPTPNPKYDPNQKPTLLKKGGNKGGPDPGMQKGKGKANP